MIFFKLAKHRIFDIKRRTFFVCHINKSNLFSTSRRTLRQPWSAHSHVLQPPRRPDRFLHEMQRETDDRITMPDPIQFPA